MQNDSDFPALGGGGDVGGNDADKSKVGMAAVRCRESTLLLSGHQALRRLTLHCYCCCFVVCLSCAHTSLLLLISVLVVGCCSQDRAPGKSPGSGADAPGATGLGGALTPAPVGSGGPNLSSQTLDRCAKWALQIV